MIFKLTKGVCVRRVIIVSHLFLFSSSGFSEILQITKTPSASSLYTISSSGNVMIGGRLDLLPLNSNIAMSDFLDFFRYITQKSQEITRKIDQKTSWLARFLKPKNTWIEFVKRRRQKIRELKNKLKEYQEIVDIHSSTFRGDIVAELSELLLSKSQIEDEIEDESASYSNFFMKPSSKTSQDFSIFKMIQTPGQGSNSDQTQTSSDTQTVASQQESINEVSLTPKTEWKKRARAWSDSVPKDLNRIHLINPIIIKIFSDFATKYGNHSISIGDIGCGNAYLSRMIREKLRHLESKIKIVAVDCEEMIEIAQEQTQETPSIELLKGTGSRLSLIADKTFHIAIYNFVLQDCVQLEKCFEQLSRVLKLNGQAIITIPHPAFPAAYRQTSPEGIQVYTWRECYFTKHTQHICRLLEQDYDPPICVFSRPISEYVNEFIRVGFVIEKLIEPHLSDAQKQMLNASELKQLDTKTPVSIVFIGRKIKNAETGDEKIEVQSQQADSTLNGKISSSLSITLENQTKLPTETVEKLLHVGQWHSKDDFWKSTILPMIALNLCRSTSAPDADYIDASISIHSVEQKIIDAFQKISDSISSTQKIIFVVPNPCFPSAYETENIENQSVFTWSTDYCSNPFSIYFESIFKTGLKLIGMLEIKMKINCAIFIIKKQDLLGSQSQPSSESGSSIENLSSLSTAPEIALDGSKSSSLPSTRSQ